jgi:hypothetical protein
MRSPITLVVAALAMSSIPARADEQPYFSMSIGWRTAMFDPAGQMFDLEHYPYRAAIAQFDGRQFTRMHGEGFYWDMHVHVGRAWYFGSDFTFASGPPLSTVIASGGDMMTGRAPSLQRGPSLAAHSCRSVACRCEPSSRPGSAPST